MTGDTDLTALIGSRICHDLVSPLGAIGNGLELMLLSGVEETPELKLVNEALADANARIRFFRLAFGAATEGTMTRVADVRAAIAAIETAKLSITWNNPADLPRADARRALLAVSCLEAAMPFGGRITVTQGQEGWRITSESDRFNIDDENWALLGPNMQPELPAPSRVQFALLAQDCRNNGYPPQVSISEGKITLTV